MEMRHTQAYLDILTYVSIYYNTSSCLFQGVLPIYKYPKVIQGPNINERGPNDGNFIPEKYFKCPVLDHKVEKIDVSFKWRDQVIFWKIPDFPSLSLTYLRSTSLLITSFD